MTTVTLYDDEAERIYLHRDGDTVAWDITQLVIYFHPDVDDDGFVALARDWHDANPGPNEIPSEWGLGNPTPLTEAQVHPYEAVARWTPDGGLALLNTVRRDVRRFLGVDAPSDLEDRDIADIVSGMPAGVGVSRTDTLGTYRVVHAAPDDLPGLARRGWTVVDDGREVVLYRA